MRDYQDGVDTGSILFDITGFTLKNADLATIKFPVTALEANYPECLGRIWIHNAPWVFNTVWKLIKGWLDLVIAGKIRFTNSVKDFLKFVEIEHIPSNLGGKDNFEMKFIPPTHEANDTLPKIVQYESLINERDEIESTTKWIEVNFRKNLISIWSIKLD